MPFGVMFEDFSSHRLADDRNLIDDYLQRRGWRESVPGRRYLQQLSDSVLSLYEVIEVSPGRHCDLSDLVCGGEMLRVHEHMGTLNMVRWDRTSARILNMNGKTVFSGASCRIHGKPRRNCSRRWPTRASNSTNSLHNWQTKIP
jgi:hypothetical protein